jgi:plastocyanin
VRVSINDFNYAPRSITVKVGGAVYWTNRGHTEHTATRKSGPGPSPNSPTIGRDGGTYVDFFQHPGTITYYCTYHPGRLVGTIRVVK